MTEATSKITFLILLNYNNCCYLGEINQTKSHQDLMSAN